MLNGINYKLIMSSSSPSHPPPEFMLESPYAIQCGAEGYWSFPQEAGAEGEDFQGEDFQYHPKVCDHCWNEIPGFLERVELVEQFILRVQEDVESVRRTCRLEARSQTPKEPEGKIDIQDAIQEVDGQIDAFQERLGIKFTSFHGLAPSRLYGQTMKNTGELASEYVGAGEYQDRFVLSNSNDEIDPNGGEIMKWPEGYVQHYIRDGNVMPTERFFYYIQSRSDWIKRVSGGGVDGRGGEGDVEKAALEVWNPHWTTRPTSEEPTSEKLNLLEMQALVIAEREKKIEYARKGEEQRLHEEQLREKAMMRLQNQKVNPEEETGRGGRSVHSGSCGGSGGGSSQNLSGYFSEEL